MTDQVDDFDKHFAEFSKSQEAEAVVEPPAGEKATPEEANTLADKVDPVTPEAAPATEPDELGKLKAELEAERAKLRRATGSISGYERHLQAERAERAKLEQALAAASSKPQTQEQQDEKDESLQYLKENFPELSTALDKVVEAKLKGLDQRFAQVDTRINETVAPIQQKFEAETTAREFDMLGSAHPDWRNVVNEPAFANWLGEQPPVVQQIMDSPIAADAVWLLNQYKGGKGVAQQTQANAQAELQARRQKELSQATGVQTRSSAPPAQADDGNGSYESSFDFFARKREQQAANRR